jgi:hypothetical protein
MRLSKPTANLSLKERMEDMLRLISIASLTAIFLSLAVVSADAETWTRHWTGPYGTSRSAAVHCGYRGCGYQMQAIGPNGATWSRSGAVVHGPYRSYSYRAATGPAGNAVVTRRVWRRY